MDTKRSLHLALFSTLLACTASNAREPHFDPARLSPDDPRAHCVVGRWCWLDGEPFVAMHGLTVEGVVAASARGEMWRFNGSGWEPLGFPVFLSRPSIFAASRSDVWVAGEGRLFHYDGAAWTERDAAASGVPSGQWPVALRGTGGSDLWAYGSADMSVMHFDGMRWTASRLEGWAMDFLAVSEGEAWTIELADSGARLSIKRFDGIGWVEMLAAPSSGWLGRLLLVEGEVWFTGDEPQRFVEGEWLPLDRARYFSDETTTRVVSDSGRLVAFSVGPTCEDVHVVGTTTFCIKQDDELIWYSTDTVTWTATSVDTLEATMPPEAFDDYAPNVWAGDAEYAFGLAPEGAVRFRPVPVDMFSAPRFMLERASLAGTFEPITRGGEPVAAGPRIDLDGTPLGPTWLTMDNALHALSPEGVLTQVELPPALEGARVDRVAAIDADSAIFVAHADTGTELVLRLDGDSVRMLMEQSARTGVGSVEIDDVAVDAEGGLWVIGTADRPNVRAQGVVALFHSSDGETWARRDLWPSWGGAQLVAEGDALWIFNGGVWQLPRTVMRGTGPVVAENLLVGTGYLSPLWPYRSRLHVDETGVWLSTNDRALWLPR